MSHTPKRSVRIARWVAANPDKAESYHVERDEFGDPSEGPYSHWVYLRDGWVWNEVHSVHEVTVRDVMDALLSLRQESKP